MLFLSILLLCTLTASALDVSELGDVNKEIFNGTDHNLKSSVGVPIKCVTKEEEIVCKNVCKDGTTGVCYKKECICLVSDVKEASKSDLDLRELSELNPSSLHQLTPSKRHHIAHFCANLDIARQCIRKCMAMGKPAFCGKDHICYCGHKLNQFSKNVALDVADTMKGFADLYEKYFNKTFGKSTTEPSKSMHNIHDIETPSDSDEDGPFNPVQTVDDMSESEKSKEHNNDNEKSAENRRDSNGYSQDSNSNYDEISADSDEESLGR